MRTLINRKHKVMHHRSKEWGALNVQELPRQKFLEWNYRTEMFAFCKRLGENLSEHRLRTVFTDESYIRMERKRRQEMGIDGLDLTVQDNEELACKGLTVMSQFIKQYLRYFMPKFPEEGICAIHDFLLEEGSMADMGKWLGVPEIIFSDKDWPDEQMMGKTLKAFIGAIAEEKGDQQAHRFIIDFIMPYLNKFLIFEMWDLEDARSVLRQLLRNQGIDDFESRLVLQTGQHTIEACYAVALFVNKQMIGHSSAESLDEAEEMAAFDALKRMFEIRSGDFVFKYGTDAYDLDYESCKRENSRIKDWAVIDLKKVDARELEG